jgi:hypothetical protein
MSSFLDCLSSLVVSDSTSTRKAVTAFSLYVQVDVAWGEQMSNGSPLSGTPEETCLFFFCPSTALFSCSRSSHLNGPISSTAALCVESGKFRVLQSLLLRLKASTEKVFVVCAERGVHPLLITLCQQLSLSWCG